MAAHVTVALDTTAPSLTTQLASDGSLTITAGAEATEMKVWGSIDVSNPANAGYGETEGAADWVPFDPSVQVALSPGDGAKTIRVRVRDEVWNQSAAVAASVTIGEVVTPPAPRPHPSPPSHPARRRQAAEVKRFAPSRIGIRTKYRVEVESQAQVEVSLASTSQTWARRRAQATEVAFHGEATVDVALRASRSPTHFLSETAVARIAEGPEMEAALEVLELV